MGLNMNPLGTNHALSIWIVLSPQFQKLTFSRLLKTFWILPKTRVSGQTGLNMNPLGENRPSSVDLDDSQPAIPKTDVFTFF